MDLEQASSHFEKVALRLETESVVVAGVQSLSRLRRDDADISSAIASVPVFIRSVGGDRVYGFSTYELGLNSIFVICSDVHLYPFRMTSTLIECVLKLMMPETTDPFYFSFLGKIERIVQSTDVEDEGPAGFSVRILQANFDERKKYDLFVELQKGLARMEIQ